MKQTLFYALLLALTMGGSCKQPLDVVEEVGEPPLPPQGCRIVKTYYKSPTIGRQKNEIVGAEMITLDDGSKMEVSLVSTVTYHYDQQHRIIELDDKNAIDQKAYRLERYTYEFNRLINHYELNSSLSTKPTIDTDTIWLNAQGLQTYFDINGQSIYSYNADQQLLARYVDRPNTHTYKNGNLKEAIFGYPTWIKENGQWIPTDFQLRHYEYNLSRPNLPVIYQFYGNSSRNLLIKEVWEVKRSSTYPDGPVYQKTYTYTYNKQGLIKRSITHGTALYRGWLLEDNLYGVGVTDYEYECP